MLIPSSGMSKRVNADISIGAIWMQSRHGHAFPRLSPDRRALASETMESLIPCPSGWVFGPRARLGFWRLLASGACCEWRL